MIGRPSLLLLTAATAMVSMVTHAVSLAAPASEQEQPTTRLGVAIKKDLATRDQSSVRRNRAVGYGRPDESSPADARPLDCNDPCRDDARRRGGSQHVSRSQDAEGQGTCRQPVSATSDQAPSGFLKGP